MFRKKLETGFSFFLIAYLGVPWVGSRLPVIEIMSQRVTSGLSIFEAICLEDALGCPQT